MALIIANSFSVNMLDFTKSKDYLVLVSEISPESFLSIYKHYKQNKFEIVNAIGHEGTAKLVSLLTNDEFNVNRIEIKIKPIEDDLLVIVPKFRLNEGEVLDYAKVIELYNNSQLSFYYISVSYKKLN